MDKVLLGDIEISVNLRGAGEPVLFISGLGGKGDFWSSCAPYFSPNFLVITHDHRGCGESTRSKIDYSIDQMATDVLSLMDVLSIKSANIVGHSTGGAIGQLIAVNAPHRVKRLVLSSTWPGPSQYFTELFKLRLSILKKNGPEAYLLDGILRGYPPSFLSSHPDIIRGNTQSRLESFPGVDIEESRINALLSHDIRFKLKDIDIKTLVVCAKDDQITPVEFSDELVLEIPGAKQVVFPYGGHFTPLTLMDAFNQVVGDFLRT
jgi:aminoacrylate hydrolase